MSAKLSLEFIVVLLE